MISDQQLISTAAEGRETRATNQVQNVTFWVCGKVYILLKSRTAHTRCKVSGHISPKLTTGPYQVSVWCWWCQTAAVPNWQDLLSQTTHFLELRLVVLSWGRAFTDCPASTNWTCSFGWDLGLSLGWILAFSLFSASFLSTWSCRHLSSSHTGCGLSFLELICTGHSLWPVPIRSLFHTISTSLVD